MIISAYDPATGRILQTTNVKSEQQANEQYANWIEGAWPNDRYRVINGQAVELPPRPDTQFPCRFNFATQQWEVNTVIQQRALRQQRNNQLSVVDRVNPVWYSTLSDQQRTELAAYRQALLDVPQQPGWPSSIDWPVKPSWL